MRHLQRNRKTYPISLIVEGKSSLVVGGGKGALRKIENLIHSGAAVTVVSPAVVPEVKALAEEGRLRWIPRAFAASDLKDHQLVYAATSDSDLNRSILELCRKEKILCCPVDRNWPEGDFMTPATFRKEELSISISTGGTSCRRSRLVKQSLSRHVDMIDSADLLLIGTSHMHLNVDEREPFHLAGDKLDQTGKMLRHVWGVQEFMILNTCNRVEIMAIVSDDESVTALVKRILGFDGLRDDQYYVRRGWEAFRHSGILMAGLLSQTPGENHIVAQAKEAFQAAADSGWAGVVLEDWFSRSLGVSKKIRRAAGPLLKDMEIEDVAMEYLARSLGNALGTRKTMIIGTGIIGKAMLEKFLAAELPVIWCYHRFIPELSERQKALVELCPLNELYGHLSLCNCVVTATGSPDALLDASHTPRFSQDDTTILVDLSLPRNIAADLHQATEQIRVLDLDDLKHWFRREVADMDQIMGISRNILEENRDSYERISGSLQSRNP